MNIQIWLEELSYGSNFGNLRAIGSNRVWYYFLVHTFKINRFRQTFPESLKIWFGCSFVSLRAFGFRSFDSQYTPFKQKKTALDYLYPFLSFSVHDFCGRADRHFLKKFYFFLLIKNIYTCLYLSRLFFKFHPHSDQS